MKTLRKRRTLRHERETHQFRLFVMGAVVVLLAVFLVGLQVGRIVEKNAVPVPAPALKGKTVSQEQGAAQEIRKEMGAYSEEAVKVPAVPPPPPTAKDDVKETERNLTFRDTLARKNPEPVPLVRNSSREAAAPAAATGAASRTAEGKYLLQAASYRDKEGAESMRRRLENAGFAAKVSKAETGGKEVFRVVLGPFADKAEARKVRKRLKNEMKVSAIIVQG